MPMRTEWGYLAGIAVALIVAVVYLPALSAGFNADDYLILWRVKAIEVRDTYEGGIAVPLPELSKDEQIAVANLVQQGTDQLGMRVSSVLLSLIHI